jgi:hypothetical protein
LAYSSFSLYFFFALYEDSFGDGTIPANGDSPVWLGGLEAAECELEIPEVPGMDGSASNAREGRNLYT